MEPRVVRLEAPESVQAVLDGYDPATDRWSFSFDSPFWKAVRHAHSRGRRGQGRRVAVIDTGCNLRYPRLQKLVDRGVNSLVPGPETEAVQKHGTAVALLISEVAPDCRLDVYRVVDDENRSDPFATVDAIRAAAQSAAVVINLSLGETRDLQPDECEAMPNNPWDDPESLKRIFYREEPPCPLCQAAADAIAAGKLVFASVGNSVAHVHCPARMDGVVAVGFRRPQTLDVSPGKQISVELRTLDESACADVSLCEVPGVLGSSFACPLYAGAAALGVTQQEMADYISAIQRSAFPTHYHSLVDTGNAWKNEPGLVREIERHYLRAMTKIPHVHCAWQARLRPDLPPSDPDECVLCGLFAENLYVLFGLWLRQTDRHAEAKEILEMARAVAPWSAQAWSYLGGTYYVLGDLSQAIRHLEQADLLRPGRAEYADALATLRGLARQRDARRSTLAARRLDALARDPHHTRHPRTGAAEASDPPGFGPGSPETDDAGDAAQAEAIRAAVATGTWLADAVPEPTFRRVDYQCLAIAGPVAFTAHAGEDDSYAVALDIEFAGLLPPLFVAAAAAQQQRDFSLFRPCAESLVGAFYHGLRPEFAPGLDLLERLQQTAPIWVPYVCKEFGGAAIRFAVLHELGHIHLGHFHNPGTPAEQIPLREGSVAVSAFADHDCDYKADEWAAEWNWKAAHDDRQRQAFAVAAPALCLQILSFLAPSWPPGSGIGQRLRDAHPPEARRAARLRDFARRELRFPPNAELLLLTALDDYLLANAPK
jgi:tetratricopeptide (TPR) repeat protein